MQDLCLAGTTPRNNMTPMFTFGPRDKVFDFKNFPPLIKMAAEEGVDVGELLADTGIPETALQLEDYKASATQLEALMNNIVRLCRPGITFDYGTRLNLSAFGIVGYAALSSPTTRDALNIASQYMPIVMPLLDIQLDESDSEASIVLELTYPIENQAGQALLEVTLASLYTMASFVLLNNMPRVKLEVQHQLRQHQIDYAGQMNVDIEGECERNRIIFPADVLNFPLPLADQATFTMSVKQCDEIMENLPKLDRSLSTGIQRRLLHNEGELPSQEDIAKELFMSVRTLHRLLRREGTSFREITNETLMLRAKRMLEQDAMSVSQIALELGYSDSANFTRAFRNQTGATPSEYRKSALARAQRS